MKPLTPRAIRPATGLFPAGTAPLALVVLIAAAATTAPAAPRRAMRYAAPRPLVAESPWVPAPSEGLTLAPGHGPRGTVQTYGSRQFAGRTYLITPGQYYPAMWEDGCQTRHMWVPGGIAPWPGVGRAPDGGQITAP